LGLPVLGTGYINDERAAGLITKAARSIKILKVFSTNRAIVFTGKLNLDFDTDRKGNL
jgi:hypothetical protein